LKKQQFYPYGGGNMRNNNWKKETDEMKTDTTQDNNNKGTELNTKMKTTENISQKTNVDETKKDMKAEKDWKADIDKNKDLNKETKGDIKNPNRAELDLFIKNLHYPVKKQDILDSAMRDGNDSKISSALQMITEKYYSSADELTRELATVG
jgi:hypothetical protein